MLHITVKKAHNATNLSSENWRDLFQGMNCKAFKTVRCTKSMQRQKFVSGQEIGVYNEAVTHSNADKVSNTFLQDYLGPEEKEQPIRTGLNSIKINTLLLLL